MNVWKYFIKSLEKYLLYIAKNIFQRKKSQQNIKLNRNLRNIAKKFIIDIEIFDSNKINSDNIEEDIEEKDKENLELFTTNSYLHMIAITYIY